MRAKIGGQRPRPRVALVVDFEANDLDHFERMFPNIWRGEHIVDLQRLVDIREIDLVIIASGIDTANNWPQYAHVICFSKEIRRLPGPIPNSYVQLRGTAQTEEFLLPDIPLSLSRRRDADIVGLSGIRGWPRIIFQFEPSAGSAMPSPERILAAGDTFKDGAIICESHTNTPLAVTFLRVESKLGVAWLPTMHENQAVWVEILVTQWAQFDQDAFPTFRDWTELPEWMVPEEEVILSEIQALEQRRQDLIAQIDQQIGELTSKLFTTKRNANRGRRRLITAQGDKLVDEVAKVFGEIGFRVTLVDRLVKEKAPKREDLRLQHSAEGSEDWDAIVEVRGYARSGGTTSDLLRLDRFANLFEKETGKAPDKRIYVINGQLELLPSQRQEPLSSAKEDLEIFAESDGVVIWTLDLFRALKATDSKAYSSPLESIKRSRGRWVPPQWRHRTKQ